MAISLSNGGLWYWNCFTFSFYIVVIVLIDSAACFVKYNILEMEGSDDYVVFCHWFCHIFCINVLVELVQNVSLHALIY